MSFFVVQRRARGSRLLSTAFGGGGRRDVESLLAELAASTDAAAYLAAQDRAAVAARERYGELVDAAYDAADPAHRREALHLVAHLGREGFRTVLQDSRQADPDPAVRACAEAFLFRVIARDRVRASVGLDEPGFAAYLQSVRVESAARWVASHAAPGTSLGQDLT